jgi:hypothetical protein
MAAKLGLDLGVNLREDRPGQIARAAEALSKARINADGLAEIEGTLHVLTKKSDKAKRALEAAGFRVRSSRSWCSTSRTGPGARPGSSAASRTRA